MTMKTRTSMPRKPQLPTPARYADFVEQVDLVNLWLIELSVFNDHGPHTPPQANVKITDQQAEWMNVHGGFEVVFYYHVSFQHNTEHFASIKVGFGLLFSSEKEMTDSIFEVFKDVNLPVNTWPFLREIVSTTVARMGWQPFTLPTLKQNLVDSGDMETDDGTPATRRRASRRRGVTDS